MKYTVYIVHETNSVVVSTLDEFNNESKLIQELAYIVKQYDNYSDAINKANQMGINGYKVIS